MVDFAGQENFFVVSGVPNRTACTGIMCSSGTSRCALPAFVTVFTSKCSDTTGSIIFSHQSCRIECDTTARFDVAGSMNGTMR